MPKFGVRLLPRAAMDMQSIFDHIAERSQAGAKRWFSAFEETLQRLEANADAYGSAPEAEVLDRPVKQCMFKTRKGRTYRVVYTIEVSTVWVHRVRGPGQPSLREDEL